MKPCRAYYAPGHLVCGLMEHDGDHWAAARRYHQGPMTRFRFHPAQAISVDFEEYPR